MSSPAGGIRHWRRCLAVSHSRDMNATPGTYPSAQMKASDADRDAVLSDLSEHFHGPAGRRGVRRPKRTSPGRPDLGRAEGPPAGSARRPPGPRDRVPRCPAAAAPRANGAGPSGRAGGHRHRRRHVARPRPRPMGRPVALVPHPAHSAPHDLQRRSGPPFRAEGLGRRQERCQPERRAATERASGMLASIANTIAPAATSGVTASACSETDAAIAPRSASSVRNRLPNVATRPMGADNLRCLSRCFADAVGSVARTVPAAQVRSGLPCDDLRLVGLKLIVLVVTRVVSVLGLSRRETWWKDAKILILRHQLAVALRAAEGSFAVDLAGPGVAGVARRDAAGRVAADRDPGHDFALAPRHCPTPVGAAGPPGTFRPPVRRTMRSVVLRLARENQSYVDPGIMWSLAAD